jgi:hypothetical protein
MHAVFRLGAAALALGFRRREPEAAAEAFWEIVSGRRR